MTGPVRTFMTVYSVSVEHGSDVSEARRLARSAAIDAGVSETDAERAAIVATEAGTNLLKHAGGGDMLVRPDVPGCVVDIIATDRGPGMVNVAECLRDGYTTAGTRGHGLGAIVRQSDFFDAYSLVGKGTVVVARIGRREAQNASHLQVDGLSLNKKGEFACGDDWGVRFEDGGAVILVADGLGHGQIAADAAREAVAAFGTAPALAPLDVLDRVHRALAHTRGAAVAVARVEQRTGRLTYAGVGNISGTVESDGPQRHLVSLHGTAGHQIRRLQDFTYPWTREDLLVMHSDGVTAHWSLGAYPGLMAHHPLTIAAVLLRDFSRGRDDATVVVAKNVN